MTSKANRVVTGKVRISYANVWVPKSINGSEPKYSVSLIISKSDTETLGKIKAAIKEAEKAGIEKFGTKFTSGDKFKWPLKDGDKEFPEDAAYKDSYFVSANSADRPTILDKNKQEILDKSEFYSGCYGRAVITFFPFDKAVNKGIGCGLEHLQKVADGEPLGGRSRAEDVFDTWEDDGDDDFLG